MELILKGEITKLGSTYGVIKSDDYEENHFFIKSDIIDGDKSEIKIGQKVTFELKSNKIKKSKAYRIRLLSEKPSNNFTSKPLNQTGRDIIEMGEHPRVSVDAFVKFITSDFKFLSSNNQELNDIVRVVVQDNKITEIEKSFLIDKTEELNLSQNLLELAKDYMFSNNPFIDNILKLIFKDGLVKENELSFLKEKAKENSFSNSFTNNRFWQYAFYNHVDALISNKNIRKIIKLWYVSQNSKFNLALKRDWILLQLNIFSSNCIDKNIDRALLNFEKEILLFFRNELKVTEIDLKNLYKKITLERTQHVTANEPNIATNLSVNNIYKKTDLYSIFNVSKNQQNGKWNNGYCEHDGNWFIFANIDQMGSGFNTEFNYNNNFDKFGDLNWEAVRDSKLEWGSIQGLKSSTPYIFIRTPKTKKHHWEFIGTGYCIYTLDTSPVIFKWKINRDDKTKVLHNKTASVNPKKRFEWNSKIVPIKFKEKILKLIATEGAFEASQEYLVLACNNGVEDLGKIMDEFEKITENLIE